MNAASLEDTKAMPSSPAANAATPSFLAPMMMAMVVVSMTPRIARNSQSAAAAAAGALVPVPGVQRRRARVLLAL